MRRLEYRYVVLRQRSYPLVPLKLYYVERSIRTYALVDTGATLSVFRAEISEDLGFKIEGGKQQTLQSANSTLRVYVRQLRVELDGDVFDMPIGFSHELTTSFNILGREGFFDRYKVTFDEKSGKIVLE